MADNFKIIIFTPEQMIDREAEKITKLLAFGADYVHLRKPSVPEGYINHILENIPVHYRKRIKLHDHYHLAVKYGTGIHLNSRNNDVPAGVKNVSKSCHSIAEAAACHSMEYVTLSPVFDSISKSGYMSSPGLLSNEIGRLKTNVVALGGVTIQSTELLKEHSFSGAAMLGSVWDIKGGYESTLSYLMRRNSLLQFITNGISPEETVKQAYKAIEGGCRWIQIRMKNAPVEAMREATLELLPVCRNLGITLILNDNIELAAETDADGVHLGQTDSSPIMARHLLGTDRIIGLTVNTLEQLPQSLSMPADYFGIGPFRFTTTKQKLAPTLGTEGYIRFIDEMKRLNDFRHFVAIGGITTDDIPDLAQTGVPGIAVSGAISKADDPVSTTRKFLDSINQYIKIRY